MAPKVENILKQAMGMSEPDRALLADRLIRSLDTQVDPDWEEAWEAEIARRLAEVDSGKVKMVPWATVKARIRKSLRAHR